MPRDKIETLDSIEKAQDAIIFALRHLRTRPLAGQHADHARSHLKLAAQELINAVLCVAHIQEE